LDDLEMSQALVAQKSQRAPLVAGFRHFDCYDALAAGTAD
jgi:hypothetical protein